MGLTISKFLSSSNADLTSFIPLAKTMGRLYRYIDQKPLKPLEALLSSLLELTLSQTDTPIAYEYFNKNTEPSGWFEKERELMHPLHEKIYSRIRAFLGPSPKVLEIGAGKITSNSNGTHSHLSRFFPYENWTFSDSYDPKFAPKNIYKYFNIAENPKSSLGKYDHIIGCNVLDTISYDKLANVLKTIGRQIKPNGLLIHVAEFNYFYNSYFNACATENPNSILFPGCRPDYDSPFITLRIEKNTFDQVLLDKEALLDPSEKILLKEWSQVHPNRQVKAIYKFCLEFPKNNFKDSFENSLKTAAQENGFDIVECKAIEEAVLVNATPKSLKISYNSLIMKNGNFYSKHNYSLSPNQVLLSGNIRVFVAQKNPEHQQL